MHTSQSLTLKKKRVPTGQRWLRYLGLRSIWLVADIKRGTRGGVYLKILRLSKISEFLMQKKESCHFSEQRSMGEGFHSTATVTERVGIWLYRSWGVVKIFFYTFYFQNFRAKLECSLCSHLLINSTVAGWRWTHQGLNHIVLCIRIKTGRIPMMLV